MPLSMLTSPVGLPGGTKSSISMSSRSPALMEWRRPSSTYSIATVSMPSISPTSGATAAIGPPSAPPNTPPTASACSFEAAASMNMPSFQLPSVMSGGVSANTATLRPLTSTPLTSPSSMWNASTTVQRSSSAGIDIPDVVHGHTMLHGQFSKYVPLMLQAMTCLLRYLG